MNTSVIGARGKLIQLGDVVRRIPSSARSCGKDYTGFVIHIYNLDLVLLEIDDGAPVSVNPVYYEPTGEKVFDIDSLPQPKALKALEPCERGGRF